MPIEELIRKCIQKNSAAERDFYYLFYEKLYRLAYYNLKNADLTMEIVNDAFLIIFKTLEKLSDYSKLEKWMRTIVINKCIDYHRLQKRLYIDFDSTEAMNITAEEEVTFEINKQTVEQILKELSDMERMVMVLHVLEGFSYAEIAELLNITSDNCRQILHRSKVKLKNSGRLYVGK